MKHTFIPFLNKFRDVIMSHRKTMTTRTKKYGSIGDVLQTPFGKIVITDVMKTNLEQIANDCWYEEGCQTKDEFVQTWINIHGSFKGNSEVWLHTFKFLGE